jgi:hypothetical protein
MNYFSQADDHDVHVYTKFQCMHMHVFLQLNTSSFEFLGSYIIQ